MNTITLRLRQKDGSLFAFEEAMYWEIGHLVNEWDDDSSSVPSKTRMERLPVLKDIWKRFSAAQWIADRKDSRITRIGAPPATEVAGTRAVVIINGCVIKPSDLIGRFRIASSRHSYGWRGYKRDYRQCGETA